MGTVVLNGAGSGSTTLTPVDAVTAVITLPSATSTLATLGANAFVGNQTISGTLTGGATLFSPISAVLSTNVALNNTANFFTGPTVAQGTVGTWFVIGTIVCRDTSGGFNVIAKLWDGTTTIVQSLTNTVGTNQYGTLTLCGFITSPAGNLRISVKSPSSTTNNIIGADSGGSGDSFITAIRIG